MAVEDFTIPPLFAPPTARLTVLQALRRNLVLAAIPVVVLLAAALALGLVRKPVYTAEARLNVGGLNLTQQSVEGYVTAVQALSVAYARSIDAPRVIGPVAKQLHRPSLYVVSHVDAVPIQGSSVVRVLAQEKKPGQAMALANATAESIVKYAANLNAGKTESEKIRRQFMAASADLQNATAELAKLGPNDPARRSVQTRIDNDNLIRQSTSYLYGQSQLGEAFTGLVQLLAPASTATSDRSSVLQDYLAGALVGGLLLGGGLAIWRANRMVQRRLALEALAEPR
ncbi:MAG: hypothetical protein JOZ25_06015 [Actinobacteria bacterium]|nr:hypothetical protein [Actinomycetota bacterium]